MKHARQVASTNPTEMETPRPVEAGVAELAYQLWLERGSPIGSDQEDWFRAEEILKGAKTKTMKTGAASG